MGLRYIICIYYIQNNKGGVTGKYKSSATDNSKLSVRVGRKATGPDLAINCK